ncbi:hypothetical protein [Flavobacterium sp.]|uniref:hypothetical protein n=1 Tax=Flavobacterium sp. TaxID=239 RepID=UPI0037509C98
MEDTTEIQNDNQASVDTNVDLNDNASGQSQQDEYVDEVIELNDEEAFNYLKQSRNLEYNSLEEFLTPKEKIVDREVNPYEGVLDDDDKAYFNYKKETGRGRKDYEAVNSNLDDIPKIELARERVRKESGSSFSNDQIDAYLADTLNIDLEDMSASDEIKLASFTKSTLEDKRAEQEKYKKPVEKNTTDSNNKNEYVTLNDNSVMLKSDYEKYELEQSNFERSRLERIEVAKKAVNSVTAFDFNFDINDNGTVKQEKFTFELPEQDRQSMVSNVPNMQKVIERVFGSGNNVDDIKLQKALYFAENEGKMLTSFRNKVEAEVTERILKQRGNVNFTSNESLQTRNKEGVKIVSINDIFNK